MISSDVVLLTACFLLICCLCCIRCITNMNVKSLAMLDPNCRLNFPKSGKLVAPLILPETLHPSFLILLSILFIITNCGLHSHAGL